MNGLGVYHRDRRVGRIDSDSSGRMGFQYASTWLQTDKAFPVSLSLPLRSEPYGIEAHSYFANLLPEADVRQRLCLRLKITPGNDFGLLKLIGGECAGALTIADEQLLQAKKSAPELGESTYRLIEESQLAKWSVAQPDAFASTVGRDGVRLSLAGAQDKLPVKIEGDKFFLPVGCAPSTHFIKFASSNFKHLPENECFMAMLAKAIGLPVANVKLEHPSQLGLLVVERYDRIQSDGAITRLHQEDLCQATGCSPLRKYQKEGGPSLEKCADMLREYASIPATELVKLLRWALFNWLTGNSDAHGKNISLLFGSDGAIGLAPFYDLVCTRIYKSVDRNLAMSLGGQFDPGKITGKNLSQLASELQIGFRMVDLELRSLLPTIRLQMESTVTKFVTAYGDSPVLEMIPLAIAKQLRRAESAL